METTSRCLPIIIAATQIDEQGVENMLGHLNASDWHTDALSPQDLLTEIAGRLCYKSFGVGLNPNITQVREGNQQYLANIQGQRHGSVFEHASTSIAFLDVSRILTHELVRHRVGTAYSQESQRFVRLDNFSVYIPDLSDALDEIYDTHKAAGRSRFIGQDSSDGEEYSKEIWVSYQQQQYMNAFNEVGQLVEKKVQELIKGLGLDEGQVSFHAKKLITSALRRFIPGGVNTNILVTTNNRNWRYLIEARTTPGAEIEIRQAFNQVGIMLAERHPNTFQDMYFEEDGIEIKFKHSKI